MEWEVNGTETLSNRNVPDSLKSAALGFGDWTNQLSTEELQLNPTLAKMSFQGQTYYWKPLKRPVWAAREKSDAFSFFKYRNLLQSWGVFALWWDSNTQTDLKCLGSGPRYSFTPGRKLPASVSHTFPLRPCFHTALHRRHPQEPLSMSLELPTLRKKSEICQWAAKDPK